MSAGTDSPWIGLIAILFGLVFGIGYCAYSERTCDGMVVRGAVGYECIENQP